MTGFNSLQPDMKFYSWNVWCDNGPEQAFSHIGSLEFDILCLQEVTPALLELVRTLPGNIAIAEEGIRRYPAKEEINYSVLLTPHNIVSQKEVALPPAHRPWQARLATAMSGWSHSHTRKALHAEVELGERRVHVVNAHLTLSTPAQRALEFSELVRHIGGAPAIVAGDFNILDSFYIKAYNLLHGSSLWDAMPWNGERGNIERLFADAQMLNPLTGRITHPLSRSQLDHILVSNDFTVTEATVSKDSFGSDHLPVAVTARF